MANENDPNPIDAPEPESTPEPEGAQESRPSDRRDFLRRLATMSFLTAAVLRGAMPAPAAQDDAVCGSIQTGQIVHKDVDCVGSTVESGTQDLDCGLFNGQEWARHKDNDCLSNTLAEDPGAGTYKDNDCGKSSGGTSPFYTSHSDNACQPATSVNPASPADFDCGLLTGTWGCHYDADCQPFMGQIQLGDNDCALLTDSTDSLSYRRRLQACDLRRGLRIGGWVLHSSHRRRLPHCPKHWGALPRRGLRIGDHYLVQRRGLPLAAERRVFPRRRLRDDLPLPLRGCRQRLQRSARRWAELRRRLRTVDRARR